MGIWTTLGRIAITPIRHPVAVARSTGKAATTAAVGGGLAYVGWEKMTTDKSVVRIVGDAVVGKDNMDSVKGAVDDVKDIKKTTGKAVDTVSDALTDVNSSWSGMTKFFRGIFGGNGLDMFSNFFKNLGNGNMSGLSIAGLVAAAFMIFGRFGFLGKIAGAMLGMMMIGNNSSLNLTNTNPDLIAHQKEDEQEEEQKKRGLRA